MSRRVLALILVAEALARETPARPPPDPWRPFDVIHYHQKGADFLHLLRETLGDAPFWAGIRDYTRQYAGRSVTTADFQRAMERSTRKDLSGFFKTWVYLDSVDTRP